jgi:Bacterial regulatory helix-turn-helix protein, lysR family
MVADEEKLFISPNKIIGHNPASPSELANNGASMDRFDAMRVFTRIVERRSFTRAADDLGLPRSSVTDAVKGLEARLGVSLLQRSTRHVNPTLDGEAYLSALRQPDFRSRGC